jgi:hypothetical protein
MEESGRNYKKNITLQNFKQTFENHLKTGKT